MQDQEKLGLTKHHFKDQLKFDISFNNKPYTYILIRLNVFIGLGLDQVLNFKF